MAKKFENVNTEKADTGIKTGAVYETIERGERTHGVQPTASKEEQERRAAEGRTQGRKGCKAARMTIAITTDNYDYIKIMSRTTGKSIAKFINFLIEQDRKEHADAYQKAKEVLEDLTYNDDEN